MIICHESIVLNQPPLANFPLAIAIVKCSELYSVIIRSEMSLKSKSVKRPYPEPSRTVKDQQVRQPPTEPDHRALARVGTAQIFTPASEQPFRKSRPVSPTMVRTRTGKTGLSNSRCQTQHRGQVRGIEPTLTPQSSSFNLGTWPGYLRRPGRRSTGTSPAPTAPPTQPQ